MSSPFFSLQNLRFGYEPENPLFENLSLTVQPGESLAILGPSGEGKSTLLKVMAGLLEPQDGEVVFQGVDLFRSFGKEAQVIRRRLGMTFQMGGLFDSMTCGDNIRLPLREAWRVKGKKLEGFVDKALKEVRLEGSEDLMVHELSGGMQKRLSIARALVLNPEVVLFDEPTAGLDPVTSRTILDLIVEVKRRHKMTIVTVTNDVARAFQIADRVAFLYQGDFIQVSDVDTIQRSQNPIVSQFLQGRAL